DMSNCDTFREMYEAYALGALDAEDLAAIEAHLATGCADCAKGVSEARWLVSQLAYLAPEVGPSDMLKGRLMQTVRAEAKATTRRVESAQAGVPVWLWMGVAAMLLFSVYSAWDAQRMGREVRQAQERTAAILAERANLEKQLTLAKREARILTDPASVKIVSVAKDEKAMQLEARWHSDLGIVPSGQNVPIPTGTRVWQLWLIPKTPGGKPIPSLTIRPDADG